MKNMLLYVVVGTILAILLFNMFTNKRENFREFTVRENDRIAMEVNNMDINQLKVEWEERELNKGNYMSEEDFIKNLDRIKRLIAEDMKMESKNYCIDMQRGMEKKFYKNNYINFNMNGPLRNGRRYPMDAKNCENLCENVYKNNCLGMIYYDSEDGAPQNNNTCRLIMDDNFKSNQLIKDHKKEGYNFQPMRAKSYGDLNDEENYGKKFNGLFCHLVKDDSR